MALLINSDCTACDACKPVCPNDAIAVGDPVYVIDPLRCTECVGHFSEPQCVQLCPVSCIPVNPAYVETPEQLLAKYHRLQRAAVPPGAGTGPANDAAADAAPLPAASSLPASA